MSVWDSGAAGAASVPAMLCRRIAPVRRRPVGVLTAFAAVSLLACNDPSFPAAPQRVPPPKVAPTPSRLSPIEGNEQFAAPGALLPGRLGVGALNASGQPRAGVAVVFTVTEGGGMINGDTVFTDSEGTARSGRWMLGTTGPQTVTARAGQLTATFTATALAADSTPATSVDSSGAATGNLLGRLAFLRGDTVFVTDAGATNAAELLKLPAHSHAATSAALSPDRSKVAYFNEASTDICIATVGGAGVQCAGLGLKGYHDLSDLAWSPDGRKLAFIGPVDVECLDAPFPCPPEMRDAFLLDATTIGRVPPAPNWANLDFVASLAWSPDGQKLALAAPGRGIYTVNADGNARQLIYYRSDVSKIIGVRWSPDGKSLAITLWFTACIELCDMGIASVHVDGTGFRLLVRRQSSVDKAIIASSWSPDATAITYGAVDCSTGWNPCHQDVRVVGAAGGKSRLLVPDAELLGWWP